MDLFDMVQDNFFSLLSSKNKRIYLASILQVFKVYETGTILGIEKKIKEHLSMKRLVPAHFILAK